MKKFLPGLYSLLIVSSFALGAGIIAKSQNDSNYYNLIWLISLCVSLIDVVLIFLFSMKEED